MEFSLGEYNLLIKDGQIYENYKHNNTKILISKTNDDTISVIYNDGSVDLIKNNMFDANNFISKWRLIKTCDNWIEAVNSKEFNCEYYITKRKNRK